MNEKILIQLYVPVVGQYFDICIPKKIGVWELTCLLNKLLKRKLGENFSDKNNILCERVTGKILDINVSVNKAGITSGTILMLI